jgi:hypothetical protein
MSASTTTFVSIFIILVAPLLAQYGISFNWLENILARLLLIIWVIWSIRQGPLEGVLGLLATFTLLIERNHQLLTKFPGQKPIWPSTGNGGMPTVLGPLPAVVSEHQYEPSHPELKEHSIEERHGEKESVEMYESAEDVRDSNPRLPEVAQGEAAGEFFERRGLA